MASGITHAHINILWSVSCMSKYCFEVCPKGKEMKDYLLDNNNSVYDAVIDFKLFEKECVKTCDKVKEKENADIQDNHCC